jgi:TfoX/Sxy family transcriptional regulator of competence genes
MAMFGGICATVNGNIAAGLFANSVMVRLEPEEQASVLASGGSPFDPMGRGEARSDKVMLPERVMRDGSLGGWLEKAIAFTRTLPPKAAKKKPASKASAKASKKTATAKNAAKKAAKRTKAKEPKAARP